jgi:hypothetical protein
MDFTNLTENATRSFWMSNFFVLKIVEFQYFWIMNFNKYFRYSFLMILMMWIFSRGIYFPILSSYLPPTSNFELLIPTINFLDILIEIILVLIVYKNFYENKRNWLSSPLPATLIIAVISKGALIWLFINSGFK